MNLNLLKILATLIILNIYQVNGFETELKLVQVLFRHGDRTPIGKYNFDTFKETDWSKYGGYGQLTQNGMQTSYKLGLGLKSLYKDFIGDIYDRNKVYIRSTDFDRTIMSAQSVLSGLFKPVNYQIWNDDIKWQPIPVHTTDVDSDELFNSKNCPKYDLLKENVFKSKEFMNKKDENRELIKNINDAIKMGDPVVYTNLERIADSIYIQKENGFKLPKWANQNYKKIRELGRGLYNFYFYDTEMAKLISGSILNEMRLNIENKSKNSTITNQMNLYSSHDNFVAGFIKLLNLPVTLNQPNYASAIVLELRKQKNSENKYFIRVLFKNNWNTEKVEFKPMKILNCKDELCPINDFLEMTKNLIVKKGNKKMACKLESILDGSNMIAYFLYTLCGFIGLFFITISFIKYKIIKRKAAKRSYQINLGESLNLMISDDELYSNNDSEVFARSSN